MSKTLIAFYSRADENYFGAYHFVQVVAVGGYSAYIITLTANEKDFESVNADFDKIISNFYFN